MNLLIAFSLFLVSRSQSGFLFIQNIATETIEESKDPAQMKLYVILLVAFAFIAVFGLTFVVRAYQELKKQYRVIEKQHDEIADKNKELAFKNESLEA